MRVPPASLTRRRPCATENPSTALKERLRRPSKQRSHTRAACACCSFLFSRLPLRPCALDSYALLYFTVLSPHGVVLTAYLQTRQISPPALAAFRAAGALSGVAGMGAFRLLSDRLGLRRLATLHLWLLALAVFAASLSFYATQSTDGLSSPMLAFLGLVVISRFGLYGFDLAVLQLQQIHVDETHRNSVGAVESSLCSLGTATLFVATLVTSTVRGRSHTGIGVGFRLPPACRPACMPSWSCD